MRRIPPVLPALFLAALTGCTSPSPAPTASRAAVRGAADPQHPRVPPENVRDVMQAKLALAHAILEGIAIEDFEQVEINALELQALSNEAGWRVHTTVAYGILSDEFGVTAAELADDARTPDIPAITRSYMRLTESCIACHDFLRREGLYREVPGQISTADTTSD